MNTRSVTSKTAPSRFDAVSSGPKTRKLRASALSFMTSRRNAPRTRVASAVDRARGSARRRRSRGSRASPGRAAAPRRWRADSRPSAARLSAPAPRARARAARLRRRAPRAGSSAATARAAAGAPGLPARSASGTWCERHEPSVCIAVDRLRPGPAFRRAQHDHRPHRAAWCLRPRARRPGCSRIRSITRSSVAAIAWCIRSGSSPSTKCGS